MKLNKREPSTLQCVISFIPPIIIQILLLIFQICHLIISIWNIFASAILLFIFIGALKTLKSEKNNVSIKDPDIITGGSTIEQTKQNSDSPSKKSIFFKIIVSILAFSLSILFFNIHSNKSKNLILVNSTVISQNGETIIETEDTGDGITQSEKEKINVIVEYEFDGTIKKTEITKNTTSKIHVDELKIYVNQDGEYVALYGSILNWKIQAIILLSFAIAMLLITIFSLSPILIVGSIFLSIGLALFFLVGGQFIEDILFNDISCFCAAFVNVGLYIIIAGIISLIFPEKEEQLEPSQELSREESMKNLKQKLQEKYNNNAIDKDINETNKSKQTYNCKNCGSALEESHKFCTHCGTKKD